MTIQSNAGSEPYHHLLVERQISHLGSSAIGSARLDRDLSRVTYDEVLVPVFAGRQPLRPLSKGTVRPPLLVAGDFTFWHVCAALHALPISEFS
jgi:hypothetical protein